MNVEDILKLIECEESVITAGVPVVGAALDSREIKPGNLFFAAKGSVTDGAIYAESALEAGAAAVITDNADRYKDIKGNKILVKDTLAALRDLGKKRLAEFRGVKIAVTGSYGKTGVKDMLHAVLKERMITFATEANHNNELGVCLTAAGLPSDTELAVFEIGSNAPGETAQLTDMLKPQAAIVTGIGYAHIGRFGSLEETAKEKLSVIKDTSLTILNENLKKHARRYYPGSNAAYFGETEDAEIRLTGFDTRKIKAQAQYLAFGTEMSFVFPYPYRHLALNFGGVLGLALLCSYKKAQIQKGLRSYKLASGRGNILKGGGLYLIDDSYNASLDSVLRCIEALANIQLSGEKYAVLGEIREIEGFDEFIYNKIFSFAERYPEINFFFVGSGYSTKGEKPENAAFFETSDEVSKRLAEIKKGVILLKASHSLGFSRFREEINKRVGLYAV
jgi:UDP-N-acetylmuramoyl-tripeptide--D-alanyl-D-alanine ligase